MRGPEGETSFFAAQQTELHGHAIGYRTAGSGPPVVLIHGMLNSSRHWRSVARRLSKQYTVVAPDLHGHGHSAGPAGDYSIGAHAAGIRDLLAGLGIDRATIVGHSLGGGIAMQFFYQFPERCERLALISSGGLGREVSWPLRLAAAPGVEALMTGATSAPVLALLAHLGRENPSVMAAHRALEELGTPEARRGFLWTLRSVIGVRGQRVAANDRLYLLHAMPTLIAWGDRDNTIPVEHGRRAHAMAPGSRFELLEGAAHFPHLETPAAVADALERFIAETDSAELTGADWSDLLQKQGQASFSH